MAKKRKTKPAVRVLAGDGIDLNRWCIERAMQWPTYEDRVGGYGAAMGGGAGHVTRVEADVLGRAAKIREWVTKAA